MYDKKNASGKMRFSCRARLCIRIGGMRYVGLFDCYDFRCFDECTGGV